MDISIWVNKITFFGMIILNDFDISDIEKDGNFEFRFFFTVATVPSSSSRENPTIDNSPNKNTAAVTISRPFSLFVFLFSVFFSVSIFSFQNDVSKETESLPPIKRKYETRKLEEI